MENQTKTAGLVVGGVNTHKDLHVASVVYERNHILGTQSFATTASKLPSNAPIDAIISAILCVLAWSARVLTALDYCAIFRQLGLKSLM